MQKQRTADTEPRYQHWLTVRERALLAVVLVVGTALRLRQYLYNRSLWIDEAFLSLNIVPRSFDKLLEPLGWDQTGPILFLWAEKVMVELFGVNEYALRAFPMITGVALLPATYGLARQLFGSGPALLATAIAALSPHLIRYATEVKSYGTEALVTVVLAILTIRNIESPEERQRWALLALAGAVAIFMSTPAVFVLAGVVAALLLAPSVRTSRRALARCVGLAACWAVVFAIAYIALLKRTADNEFLNKFFAPTFLSISQPDLVGQIAGAMSRMVHPTIYLPSLLEQLRWVMLVVGALGVFALACRRGPAFAALFGVPYAATIAASVVERFPIIPRTMLFAAPLLIIAVAGGVFFIVSRMPRRFAAPSLVAGAFVLLFPPSFKAIRDVIDPFREFDVRPAVETLARLNRDGEPVYIAYYARPAYAFYTTDWNAPDEDRIRWFDLARSPRTPNDPTLPPRADGGDSFARPYQGRIEIVQRLPVGVANNYFSSRDVRRLAPQAWAPAEAQRIRSYAHPYIWVLLTDDVWGNRDLYRTLRAAGGNPVYSNSSWKNVSLYRFLFE